ncbi:MAG: site-specific integrase [Clostridia bacterium]|nr:site-specific integrase [Clostridia bacterium]
MPKKINAKNNGSVRQRDNGTWEARCVINGKRVSFYGAKQSDALKAMRAAQKAADDGTYFEPSCLTVREWLEKWLDEYVALSTKPLTLAAYRSSSNTHIIPALGKIPLKSLNPTQIQEFYNSLTREKGLSAKTVKNVHGILHEALDQAVKLRYIGLNASDACTLPRVEKKELQPLTEDEIVAFLREIADGEPLKNLFTVALFTGMREGEVCGLSWDSVDFINGTITVKQQLCREKKKDSQLYIGSPKNDKSRTLTVAPFVMEILRETYRQQNQWRKTAGAAWENEWNLVFTTETGRYIIPQTAFRRFKRIAEKIGRPDARFHDLRHTFAVTSIQEGDDIKTVQENLGHATASFTLDVYGHVSEKMKKESAARMQSYFEKIGG